MGPSTTKKTTTQPTPTTGGSSPCSQAARTTTNAGTSPARSPLRMTAMATVLDSPTWSNGSSQNTTLILPASTSQAHRLVSFTFLPFTVLSMPFVERFDYINFGPVISRWLTCARLYDDQRHVWHVSGCVRSCVVLLRGASWMLSRFGIEPGKRRSQLRHRESHQDWRGVGRTGVLHVRGLQGPLSQDDDMARYRR